MNTGTLGRMQMLSSALAAADPLLEHPVCFTLAAAKTQQWIPRLYISGLNFRGSRIMREISNHAQCAMFNGFNMYSSLHCSCVHQVASSAVC